MTNIDRDIPPLVDRHAKLERGLIDQFLKDQGFDPVVVRSSKDEKSIQLLVRASQYASGQLAVQESRDHYSKDIHGATQGSRLHK